MKKFFIVIISALLIANAYQKTKEEWKGRIIYQILTDRFARDDSSEPNCDLGNYCGGTYKGIIKHLDYIADMGFNAIWISPIIENVEGNYHGYAFTNLYKLNPHFGTEEDFNNFVSECHKRDIWVMVDVVANHCGIVNEDWSKITPFNKAEYYHDKCDITDWNNQYMVENCRLCGLPDLKQEHPFVEQKLLEWIHDLVIKYDIDGIRIDTVPEVPKWFWTKFRESAGVFQIGEVFNGNVNYVAGYQGCLESVFNYPLYYSIFDGFCGSLKSIEKYLMNTRDVYPDPTVLGVFVDNHDNPRFLSRCGDRKKFENAVVFSLTWEGIPVFYYGGEQWFSGGADPQNREPLWGHYDKNSELYQIIAKVNKLRKDTAFYKSRYIQRYSSDSFYAFSIGENILVCLTRGENIDVDVTYHPFKAGDKLCNILEDGDCVTVENNGIPIKMKQSPKVYVKQ